mmetsp:Transcript_37386/g.68685  ORF Transcript_37386/g.68685 Transcript_37386/m.68685 type:complete len:98 (+) Transcript_37386:556-849(+)
MIYPSFSEVRTGVPIVFGIAAYGADETKGTLATLVEWLEHRAPLFNNKHPVTLDATSMTWTPSFITRRFSSLNNRLRMLLSLYLSPLKQLQYLATMI